LVLSAQVEAFIRQLAPEPKKLVRQALAGLAGDRGDITSLDADLEGYHRLRIGKYRIIFRYTARQEIYCSFMQSRPTVYQLFTEARDLFDPR
jgi:mRNA-degrading endonuclease RelE of RelBE toxin-antitoxin system